VTPGIRSEELILAAVIELLHARNTTPRVVSWAISGAHLDPRVSAEIDGPLKTTSIMESSAPRSSSRFATLPSARRWRLALASSTCTTTLTISLEGSRKIRHLTPWSAGV